MPRLFDTHPVDRAAVEAAALAAWGLALGRTVKASQNHTFEAASGDGARAAVRATPDPDGTKLPRIAVELAFVRALQTEGGLDGVCAPLPPRRGVGGGGEASQEHAPLHVVAPGGVVLSACPWAAGAPVDFAAMGWMTDEGFVRRWGGWLARSHAASRRVAAAHPELAARVPLWSALHDGVMAGAPLHPDDAAVEADALRQPGGVSASFLVCHGDLNVSNFHVDAAAAGGAGALHVFDWDQLQRGWVEWDLAQAGPLTVAMLAEGGSLPAGDPVPAADLPAFTRWLVGGYEAEAGPGAVDAPRLRRMLQLRKLFYRRFCERAQAEGGVPPDMAWFIEYVLRWLGRAPPQVEWGAPEGGGGVAARQA